MLELTFREVRLSDAVASCSPPLVSAGSSSQNGSALRRELSGGSYGSKRQTMTSPSESSLSSGGGVDCGDAPLSQFDREVSERAASCEVDSEY